jgi:hypothetical protein
VGQPSLGTRSQPYPGGVTPSNGHGGLMRREGWGRSCQPVDHVSCALAVANHLADAERGRVPAEQRSLLLPLPGVLREF